MFEHYPQLRQVGYQPHQRTLDKHRLAIENVDIGVSHFPMDQQRHADRGHAFEHRMDPRDIGNAVRRTGGGMRRVKLGGDEHALGKAARHFVGVGAIGQV